MSHPGKVKPFLQWTVVSMTTKEKPVAMNHPGPSTSKYQLMTPPIQKRNDKQTGKPSKLWNERSNDDFDWRRESRLTKNVHPSLKRPTVNLLQVVLLIASCREIVNRVSTYVSSGSMLALQSDGYIEVKTLPMMKTWERCD